MGMKMLPAKKGTCPMCATEHAPDEPHNLQSITYQMRFKVEYGRWATWADAIAHCTPNVQAAWRAELEKRGYWSEPKEGEPIAEPCERKSPVVLGGGAGG